MNLYYCTKQALIELRSNVKQRTMLNMKISEEYKPLNTRINTKNQ